MVTYIYRLESNTRSMVITPRDDEGKTHAERKQMVLDAVKGLPLDGLMEVTGYRLASDGTYRPVSEMWVVTQGTLIEERDGRFYLDGRRVKKRKFDIVKQVLPVAKEYKTTDKGYSYKGFEK